MLKTVTSLAVHLSHCCAYCIVGYSVHVLWLYTVCRLSVCKHAYKKIHIIMHSKNIVWTYANVNAGMILNQSRSSRRMPVQFTVTINLPSESFTEPNASHDPVGEGWVSHDRLQWFMQGKCMLGRHETHCGVAWSLIHHACAHNN